MDGNNMKLQGTHLIAGRLSKKGHRLFSGFNPFTGEALKPEYADAVKEEIDEAVDKAQEAFIAYRKKPPEQKAVFLETIADEILSLGGELIQRCSLETALSEQRLISERTRTVNQLRLFAEVVREGSWVEARIDRGDPKRKPAPKKDIRRMLIPLGPVAVFGAGNFPLAFTAAGGDSASAWAAGCPVIYKAHPGHPGTSELLGRAVAAAAERTGMPEGIFSLLHGISTDVGMALVNHPLIKAVGFTGSFRGGKAFFDAAVRREEPIPVYAEMGSVNPVFILPGAIENRAQSTAKDLVASFTLGVGQFCTNPGLVVMQTSSRTEDFLQILKREVSSTMAGTMLSQRMKNNYVKGIKRLSASENVQLAAKRTEKAGAFMVVPFLWETTAGEFLENPEFEREVFGPSSILVIAENKKDMLRVAKKLGGHLTASLHGLPDEIAENGDLIDVLQQKAGRLIVNDFPTGVEVVHAMHHGGPYPATTDVRFTSVGTAAIKRFVRPVCYQGFSDGMLPDELKESNPLHIWRLVDGELKK